MKVNSFKITIDLLYAEYLSAFAVVATAKLGLFVFNVIYMFGRYAQE